MIYDMECNRCHKHTEVYCRLEEHNLLIKPGTLCPCGGWSTQILGKPTIVFAREAFAKNDPRWEHVSDEPIAIRDAVHLKDICQQNGNISRYLEDKA